MQSTLTFGLSIRYINLFSFLPSSNRILQRNKLYPLIRLNLNGLILTSNSFSSINFVASLLRPSICPRKNRDGIISYSMALIS